MKMSNIYFDRVLISYVLYIVIISGTLWLENVANLFPGWLILLTLVIWFASFFKLHYTRAMTRDVNSGFETVVRQIILMSGLLTVSAIVLYRVFFL